MSTGFLTGLRIGYNREGTERLSNIPYRARVFLKIFCNGKTAKISFVCNLIQASFRQIVFTQTKKMSQLVQKSRVNFLAKDFFITFREAPEVF